MGRAGAVRLARGGDDPHRALVAPASARAVTIGRVERPRRQPRHPGPRHARAAVAGVARGAFLPMFSDHNLGLVLPRRAWDGIRALDYLLSRPEVDPKHVGITGNSGVRLRVQVDTYDLDSFRPMAGVIFHF